MGAWSREGYDLAFAQRFLAGGSEGWALALTSLRDFYGALSNRPDEAGGDFDLEPVAVLAFLGPDLADGGAGVALDQLGAPWKAGSGDQGRRDQGRRN